MVVAVVSAVTGAVADFNAFVSGDGSRWVDDIDWATAIPETIKTVTTIHNGLKEAARKLLIS
jgi:hypothetical protein